MLCRIFLIALLLRVLFTALVSYTNPDVVSALAGDAAGYDRLALNLWQHGVFTFELSPPFVPSAYRAPGYPAFIALVYLLAGHRPLVVLLLQLLLGALTCSLCFQLTEQLLGNRRFAVLAGLLLACDLSSVIVSLQLLTETVFTLLLLLNLSTLWELGQRGKPAAALRAGFWLGCTALVRPEAVPFALLEALVIATWAGWTRLRAWAIVALFLSMVGCTLEPWLVRNWNEFQLLQVTNSGTDVVYTSATLVESAHSDLSGRDGGISLRPLRRAENSTEDRPAALQAKRYLAWAWISGHPWTYLRLQLSATPRYWLPPVHDLARQLGYAMPTLTEQWDAMGLAGNKWLQLRFYLAATPWVLQIVYLVWGIALSGFYLAALAGLRFLYRQRRRDQLLLLLAPCLFLALIVQLVQLSKTPRYRVPIMPYLSIAAAVGLGARAQQAKETPP